MVRSSDGAAAGLAGFGDGPILRHMRRHADGAKIGDMIGGIVRLVLTGRDAAARGLASRLQHGLRSPALGGAVGMREPAGHRQPILVLHGGVARIAELGLPSGRLAIKPAVRVAATRIGVVLALLVVEIGAIIVVAAAVLGAKTSSVKPRPDQVTYLQMLGANLTVERPFGTGSRSHSKRSLGCGTHSLKLRLVVMTTLVRS